MEKRYPQIVYNVRKKLGYTQAELAAALKLSNRAIVCNYERGTKRPGVETWRHFMVIAKSVGYHLTFEDLLN